MLEVKNLSKKFRRNFWSPNFWALQDVSFQVKQGEVVGFLGANGAGKTTSMKIIMGLITPCSGEIIWSDKLGQNFIETRRRIGFMPERPYFYPHLSGDQFLSYMGELSGLDTKTIQQRSEYWSKRLRIDFALNRKINTYSKGMLQRIGFVATVLHDPEFILLDEPLSGLDPVGRKEIKDCLRELAAKGKSILFSSHIVSDVEEICEKVIFLEQGRMVFEGSIENIISEYTKRTYTCQVREKNRLELNTPLLETWSHEGLHFYSFEQEHKEKFLKEVLLTGAQIESLHADRPTLEEVFYKIKQVRN